MSVVSTTIGSKIHFVWMDGRTVSFVFHGTDSNGPIFRDASGKRNLAILNKSYLSMTIEAPLATHSVVGLSNDAATLVTTAYQLINSGQIETGGDNGTSIERGMTVFRAVAQAFCYEQCVNGNANWTATQFLDSLSLDHVERLYLNGYQESLSSNGNWSEGYKLVKDYLDSFLPAYDSNILLAQHGKIDLNRAFKYGRRFTSTADLKQDPISSEQHQFFTMTIMPALKHFLGRLYRNRSKL